MTLHADAGLRRQIRRQMRMPVLVFVSLMAMLGIIVALGALAASSAASFIELGVLACMVVTVLMLSMEVRHEPPLMRFFAGLGFAWFAILFCIILLDYVTR